MPRVIENRAVPVGSRERSGYRTWLLHITVLAVLVASLYYGVLVRLILDWWNDADFSYGFLVAGFSAFVAWHGRRRLVAIRVAPSWSGLVLIAGALAMLIVGVLGAELFLARCSLVFLLAGLIVYFFGWGHFRALLFPWAFLFLMIPVPALIFNHITLPLQFLASRLASSLLSLVGVPVLREGNVIRLPTMTLEVAEACSGIRSLLSLGTLAIVYGYLLEPMAFRRVLLALAAVPIAVVANGLRIMGTGLLGEYWNPQKAEGFFHTFSGWAVFVLALGMLFSFHRAMRLADLQRTARNP